LYLAHRTLAAARRTVVPSVARYRENPNPWRSSLEIIVNPLWPLTDEHVLALAVSTGWLGKYFTTPGGG
jgi:hypothetical protein